MLDIEKIISNFNHSLKNFNKHEKSIIWDKIHSNHFKNINIEKLENFRNNGLSRGTDNSFLNIDSPFRSKTLEEKLNFYDMSFEEIKKFLLKENIGNSKHLLKIEDYYISNSDFKNYEKLRDLRKFCFSKKNINFICEIGGGVGELGRMIMIDQPHIKIPRSELDPACGCDLYRLIGAVVTNWYQLYDSTPCSSLRIRDVA